MITELKKKQIFVFGSNLNGEHLGGAAYQANRQFGAEWGIGEGLTGQSYAFPTLDKEMKQVSIDSLINSRNKLYQCANDNKDLEFLLTPVGTGIAGIDMEVIKKLFENVPVNITKLF